MFRKKIAKSQLSTAQWYPQKNKVKYPKWTCVFTPENNEYSLIWDKTRLLFISERAFKSWNKVPVLASRESISGYNIWKKIGFSPGSLIESIIDKRRFFITGKLFEEEKRLIATPDFYEKLGFNPNLAIVASMEEVNFHKEGEVINDIRHV